VRPQLSQSSAPLGESAEARLSPQVLLVQHRIRQSWKDGTYPSDKEMIPPKRPPPEEGDGAGAGADQADEVGAGAEGAAADDV
jgi:hypothetical protein